MTQSGPESRPTSRAAYVMAILTLWIAIGLATGFGRGLELIVTRLALGRMVWFSREFAWMSPIAYTLVMLPGAVILAVGAAITRRPWALAGSAAAFTFVGAFGLLLPFSQISRIASLILAAGIAVTVARAVATRPITWIRLAHRIAVVEVLAVLAMATGLRAYLAVREARAVAALPMAEPGAPNVLLIILDTVRATSLSLYGASAPTTPRLDTWSHTGIVFDWAFSPAPWTLPSHASMFTGAWAGQQSGEWEHPLNDELPTLAEHFRDRGYLTGGFVGNMHYTAWDSGLNRGFTHYEDYLVNWRQLVRSSSFTQTALFDRVREDYGVAAVVREFLHPDLSISPKHAFQPKRGDAVARDFLDWQAANSDRPFLAFLNFFDAHQPYYAPPEYHRFASGRPGLDTYHAAIAFLDAQVDSVLTTLQQRGVLDNTLVVVTSDHGELFGVKNLFGHAHNLYNNVLHVPLFIRFPGRVPGGGRVSQPVSLRDLAATVMDLTATGAPVPGASLASTWTGTGSVSPVLAEVTRPRIIDQNYPTARGDMQTLIERRWQYIRNGDGRVELYAYRTDSLLAHNLADSSAAADTVAAMGARLDALLRNRR